MFIELHADNNPFLINVDKILTVIPTNDGHARITAFVDFDNEVIVKESYDAVKAKLMPGFKTNDGVAERLRKREEFFKGK